MPRNCFHPVESMWLVVLYPCLRACLLLCNGSVGWCNSLHWLSPSLPVSGLSRGRTLQVFPGFCDSGCSVETVLGTICTSAALQENSGRGSIGKERQTPSQRLQICSLVCILDVYLALGCFFFFTHTVATCFQRVCVRLCCSPPKEKLISNDFESRFLPEMEEIAEAQSLKPQHSMTLRTNGTSVR